MKILIWSPLISNDIGTVGTVLNTAKSLKKFSGKKYQITILNVAKEWDKFKKFISENNINLIDLNIGLSFNSLPKGSKIKSRFTYILISIFSIFKLHKYIQKEKPDYLFVHLITFAPLVLMNIFNYNTNFILRISGYPKLNILRKFFWKISNKKIYKIFCPTHGAKKQLIQQKIFDEKKIFVVHEPIIDLEKNKNLNNNLNLIDYSKKYDKYVVTIGRLTKQKNHKFLINCFDKIIKTKPELKLLICGEGEERENLENQIEKLNRKNRIILLGYQKNIEPILKNSLFFILTSEWEDPGFVLIESMFFNTIVFSSNCKNGPFELIDDTHNGFLYNKNDSDDFVKKFFKIYELIINKNELIDRIKFNAKQKTKLFTLKYHYNLLEKILIK